jgi:hypothetical protein
VINKRKLYKGLEDNLIMTRELPFKDLEATIHNHKSALQNIKDNEYMLAKAARIDPGSEYVQRQIYEKWCEVVTDEEMSVFGNRFYTVQIQRDKNLKTYITNIVDHIKSIKGNEELLQVQFLESTARDIRTGAKQTRIVPVTGYYTEKNISTMVRDRYEEFLPEFIRPNKEKAILNEIEIMSISNITGLYDPKLAHKIEEIIDFLDSATYSRIKNSERETKKLVDWELELRDDYPYDSMAGRTVFFNNKKKFGNTGMQMYELKDYLFKQYKKFGLIILKNVKTKEENRNSEVKKLVGEKYDPENFREVSHQMKKIYANLENKSKKNQPIILTFNQRMGLLQYISVMHYINDDRMEFQIMNEEMYKHFKGKYVGYTETYVSGRDADREEYLNDPSKSPARKKLKKREERTIKNKNRKITKNDYLDNLVEDKDFELSSGVKEPSVKLLSQLMENRYKNAIRQAEY